MLPERFTSSAVVHFYYILKIELFIFIKNELLHRFLVFPDFSRMKLAQTFFVFRNDSEISGEIVFFSFVMKNLILIIKQNGKNNFHLFNRINYIPFI